MEQHGDGPKQRSHGRQHGVVDHAQGLVPLSGLRLSGLGLVVQLYSLPLLENQMEKNMENEMETWGNIGIQGASCSTLWYLGFRGFSAWKMVPES